MSELLQSVLGALRLSENCEVIRRAGSSLPSPLPVAELASGSSSAAALAAAALLGLHHVRIEHERVAASFRSDQLLSLDGEPVPSFAPLSGFFTTADGWVRTHANYPHHRQRLLTALGLGPDAHADALADCLAERPAQQVEDEVTAAGGIAVRVRTAAEWRDGEQAQVVARQPLLALEALTETAPLPLPPRPRVLDLTRVVAGPVATRTLARLGWDVLRVDHPDRPELTGQHLDLDPGKRTTGLDLNVAADLARLHELLAGADVLVTSYRPGALARFGLDPDTLGERYPALVQASLSAWTPEGPWGGRRGFDSIVQAATGIALACSPDGHRPGALPAQALDHSVGQLLAAGILTSVRLRASRGGRWRTSTHLARAAQWLLTAKTEPEAGTELVDVEPWLVERSTPAGVVQQSRPAFALDGLPDDYPDDEVGFGEGRAEWCDVTPDGVPVRPRTSRRR